MAKNERPSFKKVASKAIGRKIESDTKKKKGNGGRPNEGKGKRKPQTYRIEPEHLPRLKLAAGMLGVSVSDLVNQVFEDYLQNALDSDEK